MKIYGVKVEKVDENHLSLDGNLVEWDYDGAPDGLGLTCKSIGWREEDHYADIYEVVYEWLEAQVRCFQNLLNIKL